MKRALSIALLQSLILINTGWSQSLQDLNQATDYITSQQGIFKGIALSNDDLYISSSHVSSISGVSHIYYQQTMDDIDILNAVGSVHLNKNGNVAHGTSNFLDVSSYPLESGQSISALSAIGRAADYFELPRLQQTVLVNNEGGSALKQTYSNRSLANRDIITQLKYILDEGRLILTWEIFLDKADDDIMVMTYVNSQSGEITKTVSLTNSCDFNEAELCRGHHEAHDAGHAHRPVNKKEHSAPLAFAPNSYLVYPIPLEAPNEGPTSIVTAPWLKAPNASPFGWHDTDGIVGPELTTTDGNNVFAQDDLDANNFGGFSPDGGPTLDFNFPIDTSMQPDTYLAGAITNLFYMNNIMHDVVYQYGFDEVAGNFQVNNYGNPGLGNDPVIADAQDGSGINNANFGTPPDGLAPRMQMFRWVEDLAFVDVNAPGNVAGSYDVSGATFNPINSSVTADVVIAEPLDGCGPIINSGAIKDKIALIDRGSCNFTVKVDNAIAAGAVGIIICNNIPGGGTFTMGGSNDARTRASAMMTFAECQTIRVETGNGLNITLRTERTVPDTDSDLDNGIIAHEYGHGISNRLTGGPTNTGCLGGSEQMGEGWSDYYALMLQLKPGDMAPDRNGIGTYVTFDTPDGDGIRPFPYSTDFGVNPFTYNDIGSGVSIPHGVGSVWCTMLWDMTWALIEKHGYEPDVYAGTGGNGIAMKLVTEGMKFQGCLPGFVDGRDGILMADTMMYGGANSCEIWRAFARRGLGVGASQGMVTSVTDGVESFLIPGGCPAQYEFPCTEQTLAYSGTTIADGTDEHVNSTVTIDNSDVLAGSNVSIRAGTSIDVDATFEVANTGEVYLEARPCDDTDLPGAQLSPEAKRELIKRKVSGEAKSD